MSNSQVTECDTRGFGDIVSLRIPDLLNEDLCDIPVVVEGCQVKRRETIFLLHVHQLPRSSHDFLCGPGEHRHKSGYSFSEIPTGNLNDGLAD